MIERGVSHHELKVFLATCRNQWLTAREIGERAKVAPRTARSHLLGLVKQGVVTRVETFPGYRYRVSPYAESHNPKYCQKLRRSAEAFRLALAGMPSSQEFIAE